MIPLNEKIIEREAVQDVIDALMFVFDKMKASGDQDDRRLAFDIERLAKSKTGKIHSAQLPLNENHWIVPASLELIQLCRRARELGWIK